MEWTTMIGKFHPLLVHLPIGIIFVTLLLEGWRRLRNVDVKPAIWQLLWGTTALSATVSAVTGYLLAQKGGYGEELLQQHKQGGITLAILTFIISITYFTSKFDFVFRKLRLILVPASALLLVYTGHGGGSLTHGADFLSMEATVETQQAEGKRLTSLDSADVFADAVMPILQAKCVSCHNDSKKKGDLLLTSYETILKGGKTRAGVVPGDLSASELYRRITLPQGHKEFMPTDGKKPLTETQVAILEWWIENGAHESMSVAKLQPDKRMQSVLEDFFQLNREAILSYVVEPANEDDLAALFAAGYQVNRILSKSNLLEVKYLGRGKPDLSLLQNIEEQLVWLHLPNCGLTDEDMKKLASLSRLHKLNLNRNPLTDNGLELISGMSTLEYLNVYETRLTDKGLLKLLALPNLKTLFVWGTSIDTSKPLPKPVSGAEVIYRINP